MPKKNSETPQPQPVLTEERMQILLDEAARMQTLYLNALETIQTVFNFYLTFVTAVVGGVIFLLQSGGGHLSLIALLLFAALVSSVYISAISARYAYAGRYARVLDDLRQHILTLTNTPLPATYDEFLKPVTEETQEEPAWYLWLIPGGTYQMFMSFMSGAALALVVLLVGSIGGVNAGIILLASLLCFIAAQIVLNVYARMVVVRFQKEASARIYSGDRFAVWAARQ